MPAKASDGRLRLLRELGAQAVPTWAALESRVDGEHAPGRRRTRREKRLRRRRDRRLDSRRKAALRARPSERRARARRRHPKQRNPGRERVRRRRALAGVGATTALETALRVFVDALTGLSALHNMRDASDPKRQLFKLVHGGLTPDCIIVGLDGIARVVGASRPRSATARLAGTEARTWRPRCFSRTTRPTRAPTSTASASCSGRR